MATFYIGAGYVGRDTIGGGAAGTPAPCEGTGRATPGRLRSISLTLAYPSAPARMVSRLLGAALVSQLALAGSLRATSVRLTGTLTVRLPVTGTLRHVARLPGAVLTQDLPLAGTLRATTAALRGELNTPATAALAGTLRMTPVRLRGVMDTEAIELATRLRQTPARLRTTAMTLAYFAAPSRMLSARVRGVLSVNLTTPPLQGTLRHLSRVLPAELTTTFSAAECVTTPARLRGATLRLLAVCAGTLRASPSQLQGQLSVGGAALTGRLRITPATLTGQLSLSTPVAVAGTCRLPAVVLRGQVQILTSPPLVGTVRLTPARLAGALSSHVPLAGTLRATPAVCAPATLTVPGPGTLELQGVCRAAAPRAMGFLSVRRVGRPPYAVAVMEPLTVVVSGGFAVVVEDNDLEVVLT